ncbi:Glycosyl transferase group 1 [Croceitalea dokdonensis DOKDO 023]|uniref:Glycosyl transferase group 1 n=1 Tax=Croceitalea dokdonensis DOKDO 023 TaxID=1300341 RepID=A0A0P7AD14_9FLAO|nr:glycosyltransferase [Croceitalea dokdonensis]KPM30360.1 Glycosyl transferase group 1 [Croceitalea dokdonensis DOKDO 023]
MAQEKPLVLYVNNIAPLYRKNIWSKLVQSNNMELHFFFGKNRFDGIKTIDFSHDSFKGKTNRLHEVKNYYLKGKYLVWQSFKFREWLKKKPTAVILLGEFTALSNWLFALYCKRKGITVIFKGHGMYGNETGLKKSLRTTFNKLADKHLVYERHAKQMMAKMGFKPHTIHVLFNSLDYDEHLKLRNTLGALDKKEVFPFFERPEIPVLLFVGRLTKIKKLDMLISVAKKLLESGTKVNLLFIGDGVEKEQLQEQASKNLPAGTYHFFGACYDNAINAKLMAASDLCVSPGNVGLTAIHSLSFGTPVCTHNDRRHQMPEAQSIVPGKNGVLFERDNIDDMAIKIQEWLRLDVDRETLRAQCYEIIDTYYNPYYQVKSVENLILGGKPLV